MKRLANMETLRIKPSEKRSLNFAGRTYEGYAGDTVATALFAGGVRLFGRSLKYHRPRGLYSLDGECSNTTMEIDGVPNVRSENTLLEDGMVVKAQNVAGSPENDRLAGIDKLDRFMPAGFYYKTMHKPASLWPVAMKQIRKAAGMGVIAPEYVLQGNYDEIFPQAEITVIGGGPAGMSAALAAAESGLRVILLESRPHLGGTFDYRVEEYNTNTPLYRRARDLAEQIEQAANIRVFKHTSMIGAYTNNLITAFQVGSKGDSFTERYIEIRSETVVVATGCIERPLIFEHNERPGIMQVACAHRLARTYGLLPGNRAVFSIGHDLGLEAAIDLHDLGLAIECVADIRENGQSAELMAALKKRDIHFLPGWVAAQAHGRKGVEKISMATVDGSKHRTVSCDLVVASAGLTPVTGPMLLADATTAFDSHTGYFVASQLPEKMYQAGRVTGLNHPQSIEVSGKIAGLQAALSCRFASDQPLLDTLHDKLSTAQHAARALPGAEKGTTLVMAPVEGRKSFICFDEDTTIKNIKQALQMGFDVPELIKRFTSAGTGPGQGGIPGHNLPLFVARENGTSETPQPTAIRPPLVPTFLATYAGAHHHMFKRTPLHQQQKDDGGIFRNIGVWKRARYFSEDFSCEEEINTVRHNVGLLDASTLGKFRIHGPDALKALQRVYVSDMSKVRQGRIKYSAMCNEDGCVIDDGVVVQEGENDYYFTTSTGRAGQTIEWIRYHTRFDNWDFHLVNLTDAMGVINIAGPRSRNVLEKIVAEDISNESFPFAGYRHVTIAGHLPVRAMRLGFVGELSYELHVPSSSMLAVWNLLKDAGTKFNIGNFGVEAQNVLRMEKCHVILGSESEQRTNLLDLGLGFLWDRGKAEAKTVGAVALRQAEHDEGRLKLVGIRMEDSSRAARDGALIVDDRVRGYVATARKSFATGEAVGMALVESQLAAQGNRLQIFEDECKGNLLNATVIATPFYDPEGKRMKM
ncbi:MAG: 2Fe-2S iron-sulfur cluster-binding protein [Desulfopila sp.]